MHKGDGKITIKDIARIAGVSIGTVDRVLHQRGRVKAETEERIRRVIRETGFTPDFFASRLSHGKRGSFGVIMPRPEQDSGYWKLCLNGMREAEHDLNSYGVDIRYFFYDRYNLRQVERVLEEASSAGCSAYAVAPVVSGPFVEALSANRLPGPVCFFDSNIPELPVLSRIGQDNYRSGLLAGRLMGLLTDPEDTVLVVNLSEDDYHLQQRVKGFLDYFSETRETEKKRALSVISAVDTDSPLEAEKTLEHYYRSNQPPGGIFIPNATTHLYARAACSAFVGYDTVPENIACIKEGLIDFLISQRPERQGSDALLTLFRSSMLGQKVSERIVVPSDIITLENLPEQPADLQKGSSA
jgi:LacI family transcriptional regulator